MTQKENPWLSIPAADYEGHMRSPQVGQLQFLSRVFGELLGQFNPRKIAVVGCATGNGFEHIDAEHIERIIGIDIQPDYLELLRERFADRLPDLELICKDVVECELEDSSLDFIFAGLLFEYVDPTAVLACFAKWLQLGGRLAVVLQLPCEDLSFAEGKYSSIQKLEPVAQLVNPKDLASYASRFNLELIHSNTETLPSRKQFFVGCYRLTD